MFVKTYRRQIGSNQPEEQEFTREITPFFVENCGVRQERAYKLMNDWNAQSAYIATQHSERPVIFYWID